MYQMTLKGRSYSFRSLNEVMGKANEFRSGDKIVGLAAADERERVAAQYILAGLGLKEIFENPAVPYEKDEVTRLIVDGIDLSVFEKIKHWTVSELREYLLSNEETEIKKLCWGMTPEIVAAVVKLCSNMDLVQIAGKIRNTSQAKTVLGRPGVLSSRLQPNHPTDSVAGITALTLEGLSYGCGDCLIGINPAIDSEENIIRLGEAISNLIDRFSIPTCACVLAHITTQMKALKKGAKVDILFQSLAGTEKANRHFGVNATLLKEAKSLIEEKRKYPNVFYFETGQGSELSLESHEDSDQVVLEARTYGMARAFSPYMVNNVSGFIGPEILFDGKQMIRANLEDLCMGKLLGLPMGMAPCYTTHSEIDQNDHEIATMLLTLGGAQYYMAIAQNDDVMLSYQDTSFHDNVSLRRMYGLKTTPEFETWMEKMNLMSNGAPTSLFGDPIVFQ
jgi:ethanolamine ammonia-lyase large subunit